MVKRRTLTAEDKELVASMPDDRLLAIHDEIHRVMLERSAHEEAKWARRAEEMEAAHEYARSLREPDAPPLPKDK